MSRISHYHLFASLFCLALLASLLHPLHAQTPGEAVARVLFANGAVEAVREGESSRGLARGDMLFAGDTIKTGQGASAQFRFTDGALIALRADTLFTIEAHHHDPQDPQQSQQSGELLRGGLRAITGAIGRERPEAVNYRTPVATIGIRGTVFEAFYVPPEGLPGLPGVAPGHYVMVLRGQVSLSNPAGEIRLADGEIGYTPDSNTPPTLRPDLAGLFARLAALEASGQIASTITRVDDDTQGEDGQYEINIGNLDDELSQLAQLIEDNGEPEPQPQPEPQPEPLPEPEPDPAGPLAFVLVKQTDGTLLTGHFLTTPVVMDGDALVSAENGSAEGNLSEFVATAEMTLAGPGNHTAGDSLLTWGYYTDSLTGDTIDFITATNVLLETLDLPTTGNFTYYYAGGTGVVFDAESRLVVSFDAATMDVLLSVGSLAWTTEGASIADFYGNGLILTGAGDGTLVGRFVGGNAEGAMSYYVLNDGVTDTTGTAVFDSNLTLPPPLPPEPDPAGPLAFVLVKQTDGTLLTGHFLTTPVVMDGDALVSAENGSAEGNLSEFVATAEMTLAGPGNHTAGDSLLTWGYYTDSLTGDTIDFITATNVLLETLDLPTTGNFTYYYAGGTGVVFDADSRLVVSFDAATMDVLLSVGAGDFVWSTNGANISDFYGNGLVLTGAGNGTIVGRFVGSNAEGAMSYYVLNDGQFDVTGTAGFDRNLTLPPPEPIVTAGPMGFVSIEDWSASTQQIFSARFFNDAMVLLGSDLQSATGGTGNFDAYYNTNATGLSSTTWTTGDSTIHWGEYIGGEAYNGATLVNDPNASVYYMAATQLLLTTNDLLPITGSKTYNYAGGAGNAAIIDPNSHLIVNFDSATLDAWLSANHEVTETWSVQGAQITDFYTNGITLTNINPEFIYGTGTLEGRFVGSGAEGAITYYELPYWDGVNVTGTALFDSNLTAYGPFGFITLYDNASTSPIIYNGTFTNEPMTMLNETLLSAYNGTGDIVSFDNVSTPVMTGSTVIGDSNVFWGSYSGYTFDARDIDDVSLIDGVMEVPTAHYVSATRMLDNINDLPVTGTISYDYVGGAGAQMLGGQLNVDFAAAQMDVALFDQSEDNWTAAGASFADFYSAGIQLNSTYVPADTGTINGRFVGSNAEGAITYFDLNNGEFIGTAVFDSTQLTPQ